MFKWISLVTKRPDLSSDQFRERWLDEHVTQVLQLSGLREYVVDFVTDPGPGDPAAIVTVRFDTRADSERAFKRPGLREALEKSRDECAASARTLYVDERVIKSVTINGMR